MTDETSPQLHVLLEMARARIEGLRSKLAEMTAKLRSLRAQEQHLREQVESSTEQRHRERDALEAKDPIRAGMGALLEQGHRNSLRREAENGERLASLTTQLTSSIRAAENTRDELHHAIAQENALARRESALDRERRRLREEEDLEELTQNANLRSLREKHD